MVITVECTSCHASFPVDPAKIPEGGVKVRCSACGDGFRVERPAPEESAPPVEAPAEPEEAAVEEAPVGSSGSDDDWMTGGGAATGEEASEEEAPAAGSDDGDDWVFERQEEVDPDSLDIQPVGTVEETMSEARDESSFFGGGSAVAEETPEEEASAEDEDGSPGFDLGDGPIELEESPAASAPAAPAEEAKPVAGFTFGQRDPKEKARRLARVLVSDMIMYNPERHERALANGTLKDDFEEEIAKSWKEYVEQVGEEMAEETDFWTEALNDVLAKGEPIF